MTTTAEVRTLLAALSERYPVIAARLPLAIGVRDDLIAAGYDAELIGRCLRAHVGGIKYQRMVARGGKRYRLDGIEAQDIDPLHVEFARQKVEEFDHLKAIKKEKNNTQSVASRTIKAIKLDTSPMPKAAAKSLPAVAIIIKKKRVLQVPQ